MQDLAIFISMFGDLLAFGFGMLGAYYIRFHSPLVEKLAYRFESPPSYLKYMLFGIFLYGIISILGGTYHYDTMMRLRRIQWKLFRSLFLWLGLFLLLTMSLKLNPEIDPVLSLAYIWLCVPCCGLALMLWRWILHMIHSTELIAMVLRQRILVLGWNQEAIRLAKAVSGDLGNPFAIIGCLPAANGTYSSPPPAWVEKLGNYDQLEQVMENGKIDIVLVAELEPQMHDMIKLSKMCERHMVQFKIIPTFFQILLTALVLENVSGVPVLGVEHIPLARTGNRILKRAVDIIGGGVGLALSIPIILLFGILIYRESPGNVLFSQIRRGRHGQLFKMFKLRSMNLGAHKTDNLSQSTFRNDPRLLKIGKFMRRHNIDEVPQFWNVLKGDMSLVGPRPERFVHASQLEHSIPYYNARLNIKPGLTGWAQIHGFRGDTDLNERIRYDLYYVENWTLWLDFYIMAMTFFRNKNAY